LSRRRSESPSRRSASTAVWVFLQTGTARASNLRPFAVRVIRRARPSAGSAVTLTRPRHGNTLRTAVRVVRSILSRDATAAMPGGSGSSCVAQQAWQSRAHPLPLTGPPTTMPQKTAPGNISLIHHACRPTIGIAETAPCSAIRDSFGSTRWTARSNSKPECSLRSTDNERDGHFRASLGRQPEHVPGGAAPRSASPYLQYFPVSCHRQ